MNSPTTLYHTPPKDFNPIFSISGCFCLKGEKVLILKRHHSRPQGETWGIPTGKKEGDEAPIITAQRELFEETGIDVKAEELIPLGEVYIRRQSDDMSKKLNEMGVVSDHYDFTYSLYVVHVDPSQEVALHMEEHTEYMWIEPQDIQSVGPLISKGSEVFHYFLEKYFLIEKNKHR